MRSLALDVALLLPTPVAALAVSLNRQLPPSESKGLVLDDTHLPHITLTQQFVRADRLEAALDLVDTIITGSHLPMQLEITGGAKGASSVWMGIRRTPPLTALHRSLMDALAPFEVTGEADAFVDGDARASDVRWVAGYRVSASHARFTPHVTLGHASQPPRVEPFTFDATTVAACHLGRFCSCRTVLRRWDANGQRAAKGSNARR